MTKKLLLSLSLVILWSATLFGQTVDANGYTQVNLTTGSAYQNRVFFDLSDNQITSQPANTWDLAFYRPSAFNKGIRINDAQNVKVYQVSATPSDYDTVDINNKSSWGDPIYNPDQTTNINDGVFDSATLLSGNFAFGWGEYDITTHKINGKVVFVLAYPNDVYYKLFINEYSGGYTFKYAKWNGSSWGDSQSKTIANGNDDAFFNYFSFDSGAKVENLEPAKANWDMMFTRYWTFYNNQMMYRLSGVIQSPNISVAKVQPETQDTNDFTAPKDASKYSKVITTIGHSWKPISGIYSDVVYYIKENSGKYYRLYFNKNGGASNGDMYFKYKDITSTLSVSDIGNKGSFGIYPNPIGQDRNATILFDINESFAKNGILEVYDRSGRKVAQKTINRQAGFSKIDINFAGIPSGVYFVKITLGDFTQSKTIIMK